MAPACQRRLRSSALLALLTYFVVAVCRQAAFVPSPAAPRQDVVAMTAAGTTMLLQPLAAMAEEAEPYLELPEVEISDKAGKVQADQGMFLGMSIGFTFAIVVVPGVIATMMTKTQRVTPPDLVADEDFGSPDINRF
eukprot:TRINITY_DN3182_c0_g1_i2.p2 TRINITY_DN3182_c0_g1~~TRINITY_DN3182_c0_g1_i2.p2  ORF type:complete len:137 (+),score=40.54 TRINITY_DN3182_c0_g1_i2:82-492(+)